MEKMNLRALLRDGRKGALIGVGITTAFILLTYGFPDSARGFLFIIGFGLGIGFLLTVGNELIIIMTQSFCPKLQRWPRFSAFLVFPVSVIIFFPVFSLFFRHIPVGWRLTYSMGAGIGSMLAGFFFVYAQEREERLRLERENQRLAVLEERNRIAQELHDSVSQNLYGISLHLGALAYLQKKDADAFRRTTRILREMVAEALAEMELLIHELQPVTMERGFYEALEKLCGLYRTRYQLAITTNLQGVDAGLDPKVQTALYRVTQEALNNVVKHAQAKTVQVEAEFTPAGKGVLRIRDDGRGFDPTTGTGEGHYGLAGMKKRVKEIGGKLTVQSAKGKGTVIIISIGGEDGNRIGWRR